MANELQTTDPQALAVQSDAKQISELLQPLIREIYLFDTFVAGTSHIDEEILQTVKPQEKLTLRREKENTFDAKAVAILTEEGQKIGYIPERDNPIFSRLMDAGKMLTAQVKSIEWQYSYCKIAIAIYLTDY